MSKSVYSYFKTKKVLLFTKPRGGGLKALVDCPLKKNSVASLSPQLVFHGVASTYDVLPKKKSNVWISYTERHFT